DVVLTGTPAGVGPLTPDDRILLTLGGCHHFETRVA
ncbi:MAG: isomerase/hydrolase, partial [Magnetococcales bacterium]|nr:isomerase/hydrolase [Magnetococcales bacterium]